MTNFAGTLDGQVREEQVFANNQWVTYRTRGGPARRGRFLLAETTKTPYTDEFQLQDEADLGNNMSGSAIVLQPPDPGHLRRLRSGSLHGAERVPGGDINDPNSLFLGWDYFGWTATNHPAANFFLGTMPGGERDYNGLEFVVPEALRRPLAVLCVVQLPGRAGQHRVGWQRRLRRRRVLARSACPEHGRRRSGDHPSHLQVGGSYTTQYGLELGGAYRWNSGTTVGKTQLLSSRRLFVQGDDTAFGGITSANVVSEVGGWVTNDAVWAVKNPSWGSIDVRMHYVHRFEQRYVAEFFVDVFNVFNDQAATRLEIGPLEQERLRTSARSRGCSRAAHFSAHAFASTRKSSGESCSRFHRDEVTRRGSWCSPFLADLRANSPARLA